MVTVIGIRPLFMNRERCRFREVEFKAFLEGLETVGFQFRIECKPVDNAKRPKRALVAPYPSSLAYDRIGPVLEQFLERELPFIALRWATRCPFR